MFQHALFVLENSPGHKLTANYYKDNYGDYCAIGFISRSIYEKLEDSIQAQINLKTVNKWGLFNGKFFSAPYNLLNLQELGLTPKEAEELQRCNDDFEKETVFPVTLVESNEQKERRYNHVLQWLKTKVAQEPK